MSRYPVHKHDKRIAGVNIPEIYPEKTCVYLTDDGMGELMLINREAKEELKKISPGQICTFENVITNQEPGVVFREYKEYVVIDACEFNLILNNGPLWEFMLFYHVIPFTTTSDMDEQIDIDRILEYEPQDETEEKFKSLVVNFGLVNTVERDFELKRLIDSETFDSVNAKGVYSSKLIDILGLNDKHRET